MKSASTASSKSPITKFPRHVEHSLGSESAEFKTADQELNHQLSCLHRADQIHDQIMALKYAEENFLNQDIHNLTALQLEGFVKNLNQKAAFSLLHREGNKVKIGEYLSVRIAVFRETGIAGKEFDKTLYYSKNNHLILRDLLGMKAGNDYKDFCQKLEKIASTESNNFHQIIAANGLASHPGYPAYQRLYRQIDPETTPTKMAAFYQTLATMLHNKEDIYRCAAYAYHQLITLHAFAHGNKRSARIFKDCLLMLKGKTPCVITRDRSTTFLEAIEASSAENIDPLANLLRNETPSAYADMSVFFSVDDPLPLQYGSFTEDPRAFGVFLNCYHILPVDALTNHQKLLQSIKQLELSNMDDMANQYKKSMIKTLKIQVIDGDYYFKLAQNNESKYPDIAKYLYKRSQIFYTADNQKELAKKAIMASIKLDTKSKANDSDNGNVQVSSSIQPSSAGGEEKTPLSLLFKETATLQPAQTDKTEPGSTSAPGFKKTD